MRKKKTTGIGFSLVMMLAAAMIAVSSAPRRAEASQSYFTTNCASCHASTLEATSCGACHAHGTQSNSGKTVMNVAGATNKTSYAPGETVSVTITGGYRTGWVRALLYDQNMVELGRSSGPGGKGGGAGFPITLSAPAPTTAGTYQWTVAWYGNNSVTPAGAYGAGWTPAPNPGHGEERVKTNSFTVTGAPPPPGGGMTTWVGHWVKITTTSKGSCQGSSAMVSDGGSQVGYLKFWNWDSTNQILQADLYQYDAATAQWSSQSLDLVLVGGSYLNFLVQYHVMDNAGKPTEGFTAQIKGRGTGGVLTGASFKSLGGFYVDTGATNCAGGLKLTGALIAPSKVPVPSNILLH